MSLLHRLTARLGVVSVLAAAAVLPSVAIGASPAAAAPPDAPVNVRVFTGGDSIAVVWDPAPDTNPLSYTVLRDNVPLPDTVPAPSATLPVHTARYVDRAVEPDRPYKYQVRMRDTANQESAPSMEVTATHPTSTTPVPTVTIANTATGGDLVSYLNEGKAIIQTWYPKIVDRLARGSYTPPSALTIQVETTVEDNDFVRADNLTDTILIDEVGFRDFVRNNPDWRGLFVHEATHLMQQYPEGYWMAEGIAEWTRRYMYADLSLAPPVTTAPEGYYASGYERASYFLNWIATTFSRPNLVRDLNILAHFNTYTDAFFVDETDKTGPALWAQMTEVNTYHTAFGATPGLCIDVPWADNRDGAVLEIRGCSRHSAQHVTVYPTGAFVLLGKCLDLQGGGTASGTPIVLGKCESGRASQRFTYRDTDSTIRSTHAGRCVQPRAGGTTSDTPLEIARCTGSTAQQWRRVVQFP